MKFYSSIAFRISSFVALAILVVILMFSNFVMERMTADYLANLDEQAVNIAEVVGLYNLEAIVIRDFSFLVNSLERLLNHEPLGLEFAALTSLDDEPILRMGSERTDMDSVYTIVTSVEGYDTEWAQLTMQFSLARLQASLAATGSYIRRAALLAVLAAVSLSLAATYRFVRPLKQLTVQAHRISQGQLDEQIRVKSNDETQVLANALEGMRVRFRQLVSEAVSKAMVWEGKLEYLHLGQLLNLLRVTNRSGGLILHHQGKSALIHVRNGEIVHTMAGASLGNAALIEILHWESGDFKFDPNLEVSAGNMHGTWTEQILTAARLPYPRMVIQRFIPHFGFVAKPVSDYDRQQRSLFLNEQEKTVLECVDGSRDVNAIAQLLDMPSVQAEEILFRLILAGFVQTDHVPLPPRNNYDNVIPLWKRRYQGR